MARKQRSGLPAKVELPITPMLDMTFQLLAFFVLTFQAHSAMEGKVDFGLPPENSAPGTGQAPAQEPGLDDNTKLTIVVRSLRDGINDGNISALLIQTPEGPVAVRDLAELRQTLQQRRGDGPGGEVRIAADCRLKYGVLMDVMDVCLQSGFGNVGFTTPPDLGLN